MTSLPLGDLPLPYSESALFASYSPICTIVVIYMIDIVYYSHYQTFYTSNVSIEQINFNDYGPGNDLGE